MNAISESQLLDQNFYPFLEKELGQQIEVYALAGDASSRKYYRVVKKDKSYVLMEWEKFEDNDNFPFISVSNLFAKHKIAVPKILAKSPKMGLMLLEDLGDLTLERKFWETEGHSDTIDFYQKTLDQLILIHYSATSDKNKNCSAFKVAFDEEKLLWELNYTKKHLLEGVNGIKFKKKELNIINKCYNDICSILSDQHRVICHRDFHSRNVMIKLGKVRIIDYQDARLGPAQYDLVSLFRDSYVDIKPEMETALLKYYLEQKQNYDSPRVSLPEFLRTYELQSIQRCFKACGSFASFFMDREDRRYIKYINTTLDRVENSLLKFPEYEDFYNLLTDYGVFERDYTQL